MQAIDDRYPKAKAELLRVIQENSKDGDAIQAQMSRLAKNLQDGGPDVSKYQVCSRRAVNKRRRCFDMKHSEAFRYFESLGWDKIPFAQLRGLIQIIAGLADIGYLLDRDSKREKRLLFQWIDHHWDLLKPHLDQTKLEIALDLQAKVE
jgi:hypothetical protein